MLVQIYGSRVETTADQQLKSMDWSSTAKTGQLFTWIQTFGEYYQQLRFSVFVGLASCMASQYWKCVMGIPKNFIVVRATNISGKAHHRSRIWPSFIRQEILCTIKSEMVRDRFPHQYFLFSNHHFSMQKNFFSGC